MKKSDFIYEDPPGLDLSEVIMTDLANIVLPEDMEVLDHEEKSEEVELWRPGREPISFLRCRTCYLKTHCPYCDFSSEICALQALEKLDTSTPDGIVELLESVIAAQARRVLRAVKIEEAEGGYMDPSVTNELMSLVSLVEKFKKIMTDEDFLIIKAKGKNATGVIERLFGDIK
jgi:hypothetical protein